MKSLQIDAEGEKVLSGLASRWNLSEEQALKRALNLATQPYTPLLDIDERLASFHELQAALKMDRAKAEAWRESIQDARR